MNKSYLVAVAVSIPFYANIAIADNVTIDLPDSRMINLTTTANIDAIAYNESDVNGSITSSVNIGFNPGTPLNELNINTGANGSSTGVATSTADTEDLRSSLDAVAYGSLAGKNYYVAPGIATEFVQGSVVAINVGASVDASIVLAEGVGNSLDISTDLSVCVDITCNVDVVTEQSFTIPGSYGFNSSTYAAGAAALSSTYIGYDMPQN